MPIVTLPIGPGPAELLGNAAATYRAIADIPDQGAAAQQRFAENIGGALQSGLLGGAELGVRRMARRDEAEDRVAIEQRIRDEELGIRPGTPPDVARMIRSGEAYYGFTPDQMQAIQQADKVIATLTTDPKFDPQRDPQAATMLQQAQAQKLGLMQNRTLQLRQKAVTAADFEKQNVKQLSDGSWLVVTENGAKAQVYRPAETGGGKGGGGMTYGELFKLMTVKTMGANGEDAIKTPDPFVVAEKLKQINAAYGGATGDTKATQKGVEYLRQVRDQMLDAMQKYARTGVPPSELDRLKALRQEYEKLVTLFGDSITEDDRITFPKPNQFSPPANVTPTGP